VALSALPAGPRRGHGVSSNWDLTADDLLAYGGKACSAWNDAGQNTSQVAIPPRPSAVVRYLGDAEAAREVRQELAALQRPTEVPGNLGGHPALEGHPGLERTVPRTWNEAATFFTVWRFADDENPPHRDVNVT